MLLPFGLRERAGLLPSFGASTQVLLQLLLFGVGCYMVTVFVGMPDSAHDGSPGMVELLGFAFPAYLFMWLLYYLSRRLDGLRTLLGYGFPLIVASAGLTMLGYTLLNGDADTGVFVMLSQAWALQAWPCSAHSTSGCWRRCSMPRVHPPACSERKATCGCSGC